MVQKQSPVEGIDRGSTALLVIDVANDCLHKDGYFAKVFGAELGFIRSVIPPIQRLMKTARVAGIPVLHIQTVFSPDYADFGLPKRPPRPRAMELKYLVKGTWGGQNIDELPVEEGDYVIEAKCYDKFRYTPLELILRNKGIRTLIFTGVNSYLCVESTVRTAADLGFRILIANDATAGINREFHDAAIRELDCWFGEVTTTEEIIQLMTK